MGLRRGSSGSRRGVVQSNRGRATNIANKLAVARQQETAQSNARIARSRSAASLASISDLKTANLSLQTQLSQLQAFSTAGRSSTDIRQVTLARQETSTIQLEVARQLSVKSRAAALAASRARQKAKVEAAKAKAAARAKAARDLAAKLKAEKRAAALAAPVNHTVSNRLFAMADRGEVQAKASIALQQGQINRRRKALNVLPQNTNAQRRVVFREQATIRDLQRRLQTQVLATQKSTGRANSLRQQAEKERRFELTAVQARFAEEDRVAAAIAPFARPSGAAGVIKGSVGRAGKGLRDQIRNKSKGIGLTGSPADRFARTVQVNNLRIALARTTFAAQQKFDSAFEARRQTAVRNSKANAVSAAIKQREQRAVGSLVGTGTRVAAPKAAGQNFSVTFNETIGFSDSLLTRLTPAPKVKAVTQQVSLAPSAAAAGKIKVTRSNGKTAILTQSTARKLAEQGQLAPESAAPFLAAPISAEIQDIIGPTTKGKKPSQFTTTAPSSKISNAITKEAKPFIQEAFAEEGGTFVDAQTMKELQKDSQNLTGSIQLSQNKVKLVGGFKAGDVLSEVQIPTPSGVSFSALSIEKAQKSGAKGIGNSIDAGFDVKVGGPNFIGGETSVILDPLAKVKTKDKPLISPTRDQGQGFLFSVKDGKVIKTPKKKSLKVINAETVATRLGNAPFVTQVDLSAENLRQGSQLLDRSNFFTTDKVSGEKQQIFADSLEGQVINRIGEEQDVKNVLNAVQEQRFQNIKNAQAEIDPITGQTIRTAGEVALDIARATPEPNVSFTFGAGSGFRPTGQEREVEQLQDGSFILTKTGGFTDENLPFIKDVLDSTPRASVQEGLGFGVPSVTLQTGEEQKINKDGSVETVPVFETFADPDRFSSQFKPQLAVLSVGKPDVIAQSKSGKKFVVSQEFADQLDKSGQLAAPLDNFETGSKQELESAGFEGIGNTFQSLNNLNATPNSPFALPKNAGQVLESSPVTEDLSRSGAVTFPSFIQTASADSGPALGLVGPVAPRPSEQVSIQKPFFDEKTLGLGEVRDKFSFGQFLENPIAGLGQFAGGATRSAQNELAGIQNIGSLASGGQIPQREFLGTPSQQFYEAVIEGGINVFGQQFDQAKVDAQRIRQGGIGAVLEDPLSFVGSANFALNPLGSIIAGIAFDPTVQQKFGVLGQSIVDNPFAAAGDISFQAATFLGPQAVFKVARIAGIIAPKAASAAQLGVKLQKGQKIEAALIQSKKGGKREVVNVLLEQGQKLKTIDNGLGGKSAIVINKKTGNFAGRAIETTLTPFAKSAILIDNSASVNRKILKTSKADEVARLNQRKQKLGNLNDLSKTERTLFDDAKKQAGVITTFDPVGTAQLLGKEGSIKILEKSGKRVLLKEKTFELIDLKTGNKKIALRQDLAESVTEMPLGSRLFDTLSGGELAVKPSSLTKQLPTRATQAQKAFEGELAFVKGKGFESSGVFSAKGFRIGPLEQTASAAAKAAKLKSQETNVFENFLSKRSGVVTRDPKFESAGAASFDPFFNRSITPSAEAFAISNRQFLPETLELGVGSTKTVVSIQPKVNAGKITSKIFDTLSPSQKQEVILESFGKLGKIEESFVTKQSGQRFLTKARNTAVQSAGEGKSLRGVLQDVGEIPFSSTSVSTGKQIITKANKNLISKNVASIVSDTGRFSSKADSPFTDKLAKGVGKTLDARTRPLDIAIPTGTLGRDAQLTGEFLGSAGFKQALRNVPARNLDDAFGISPRALGEKLVQPKSFTQSAKSGLLKSVDEFSLKNSLQKAVVKGDDFLNIQKGVIGATFKQVGRATSKGVSKTKGAAQKLKQKVKPALLDDLNPDGTIKLRLPRVSETIGKRAGKLLETGRSIKPKRGLPIGIITGVGSQVVQQFRPSTVTGLQGGFDQVLNPFESSKLGVQSSLVLQPRQARIPSGRFAFPLGAPKAVAGQAQPFPRPQRLGLLFGTPTPPARNLFGPLPFNFGRGGVGVEGGPDISARRKFFRVFDVARTPFGRVERGLGVQVQSSARIQEISDVLGKAPKENVSESFFKRGGNFNFSPFESNGNGRNGKRKRKRQGEDGIFSF